MQGQVVGLARALRARGPRGHGGGAGARIAPRCPADGGGPLRHRPARRAALQRLGGPGRAVADRGGPRRALRPPRRLRRGARARAPGPDGGLRPGADGPAPDGRHLPPGRGEPVGPPAASADRSSSGAACRSAWPSPRRPARPACARAAASSRCCSTGSTWTASSRRRRTGTPRAARPSCSSAATSRARACPSCSTPSPGCSGPPSCGWPARGRAPRCSAGASWRRIGCSGWAC